MGTVFTWANFMLLLKWGPKLLELIKRLEEEGVEVVTDIRVHRSQEKIEIAFNGKPRKPGQIAQELDDAFKN